MHYPQFNKWSFQQNSLVLFWCLLFVFLNTSIYAVVAFCALRIRAFLTRQMSEFRTAKWAELNRQITRTLLIQVGSAHSASLLLNLIYLFGFKCLHMILIKLPIFYRLPLFLHIFPFSPYFPPFSMFSPFPPLGLSAGPSAPSELFGRLSALRHSADRQSAIVSAEMLLTIPFSWLPVADPLVSILTIKHFRQFLWKCGKKFYQRLISDQWVRRSRKKVSDNQKKIVLLRIKKCIWIFVYNVKFCTIYYFCIFSNKIF